MTDDSTHISPEVFTEPSVEKPPEPDVLVEAFIDGVMKSAKAVHRARFDTVEAATEERESYLARITKNLASVNELRAVPLQVSGSGVQVPMIEHKPAEIGGAALAFETTMNEKVLQPLDSFISLDVFLDDVTAQVRELDSGKFGILSHIVVRGMTPQRTAFRVEGFPMSFADIAIFRRYLVECSNNSVVKVPSLERKREHKEIVQRLAMNGLSRSVFVRKLNSLRNAFYMADEHAYTHLADMKLLRSIGEFSDSYARNGFNQSSLMSHSILDAMGKGRMLQVLTETQEPDGTIIGTTVAGNLYNVLTPDYDADDLSPTLVLEIDDDEDASALTRIAIKDIVTLAF